MFSNLSKISILFALLFYATPIFSQIKKENKLLVGRLELSEKNYKEAIEKFNEVIKKST
jgi:protein-S-isoprenylcysteine O-methyltransferase Ste14